MPPFFKYLIVGLICLVLGSLLGMVIYNHLSFSTLLKNTTQAQTLAKEVKAGASEKKEDPKKEEPKTTDAPKEEVAKGTKSDEKKEDKKEGEKPSSESEEYLRSLWPIKKRKTADVSGKQEGPLYFEGTSPYGPPPSYKKELFEETKALSRAGRPPAPIPPPERRLAPESCASPSLMPEEESRAPIPYQIEMGRFVSLSKAQEARDFLRSKGYEAEVYYRGSLMAPEGYYVRLEPLLTKHQAYQKSQAITVLEKIVPTIVQATTHVKKLR